MDLAPAFAASAEFPGRGNVMVKFCPVVGVGRWALSSVLACLFSILGAPAYASLIGDSVTAELSSPNGVLGDSTPVDLIDTVTVADPGVEISAGDGTNIGSFMLPGPPPESIDFGTSSIVVTIDAGNVLADGTLVTGYAPGAEYIFSGLDFAGSTITGINVATSGFFANLSTLNAQPWITLDNPNQVTLRLDLIEFTQPPGGGQSNAYGVATINLLTTPNGVVPEPGSMALIGLALLTLWANRRRGLRS